MEENSDMLKIKNQIEWVKGDMDGLTALVHMTLEGIRTDSVGIDEVENAVASLYQLAETITNKIGDINEELVV
ncbi:MAG TPA: hypothetical protein DCZ23_01170 [Lachnospiraceae bacterium]|nr:hypothetical protein [Lachnospiraceae bacterium]